MIIPPSIPSIGSMAVFCGSSPGKNPEFAIQARSLGVLMAEAHIRLVYGGGRTGLMGILADTVLESGGEVTGIIPVFLNTDERKHERLTELIEVSTMHERKSLIYDKSEAVIMLPGGYGTLDEFFEIITWNQLSLHRKIAGILNVCGFYDHLSRHLLGVEEEGFLHAPRMSKIYIANTSRALLGKMLENIHEPD
ncbi:MAG TPA: TIGR00730 family Rossman fold protein [Chitinophagaceae bacterium]|nr:TIGR00730 family Rossman fold protein [Chitinophagaceae bacterium]